MKTELFSSAITNRYPLTFLYDLQPITFEPYLIARNRTGKKVIYGRESNSNAIKVFEFDKIYNIKINFSHRFSPIIPILPIYN
ncbi:MAG: hypothetical protein SCALA702_10030 [Melioribacteraceae bacterium]|nr:MAG: hypothetical protein SCALA702_10030 [Melioribacteraceae bacterium]